MEDRPYINQQNWGKDLVGRLRGGEPGEYLLSEEEAIALFEPIGATQSGISSHLSSINPHGITIEIIGAAATSHAHTGSQISGNIDGKAANITGIVEIANGGTGAGTTMEALANLGAAATGHAHTEITNHLSANNPHQISPDSIGAAFAWHTHNDLNNHLSVMNPHGITIEIIGAAPVTHTHAGSQVSGNIAGNAANITGIAAISNKGTGASTAANALTNLGAAPVTHTHAGSQVSGNIAGNAANITGIAAISNGGTGATTRQAAINALAGAVTVNRFLRGDGTNISLSQVNLGTADVTGIVPIANGGTGAIDVSSARANLQVASNNISFSFNAGWSNYSPPVWQLRIAKFSNLISISGLISRTSGTNNNILTLPSGSRPIEQQLLNCLIHFNGAYYQCRVDIATSGVVSVVWASATIPSVVSWLQINATFITASP